MAANPQIPDVHEEEPQLVAEKGKSRFAKLRPPNLAPRIAGWAIVASIFALAVITGLFYYASRVPEHARVHSQVPGAEPADNESADSELEFSDLQMRPLNSSGLLVIRGQVQNTGNHQITGAYVQLTFKDAKGRKLSEVQRPIHGEVMQTEPGVSNDFSSDPLEPGETRGFFVVMKSVPPKWDNQLPDLKVITVSNNLE